MRRGAKSLIGARDARFVEVLHNRLEPGHATPVEWHEPYEIDRVASGAVRVEIGSREIELVKGDILFLPAEVIHRTFADETHGAVLDVVVLGPAWMPELDTTLQVEKLFPSAGGVIRGKGCPPQFAAEFVEILEEIRAEASGRRVGRLVALQALVDRLLVATCRLRVPHRSVRGAQIPDPTRRRILGLLEHIDDHLDEDVSLPAVASRAVLSPFYLSRLFKEVAGCSLPEYVLHKRIIRAKRMLRETDMRVAGICFECGFGSVANFNRSFRRLVGVTPTSFRLKSS